MFYRHSAALLPIFSMLSKLRVLRSLRVEFNVPLRDKPRSHFHPGIPPAAPIMWY
jgi:hypothetical protein